MPWDVQWVPWAPKSPKPSTSATHQVPTSWCCIPHPLEGQYQVQIEGAEQNDYRLGLMNTFNPASEDFANPALLWDASSSAIEPGATVNYVISYTLATTQTVNLIAATPVIEAPVLDHRHNRYGPFLARSVGRDTRRRYPGSIGQRHQRCPGTFQHPAFCPAQLRSAAGSLVDRSAGRARQSPDAPGLSAADEKAIRVRCTLALLFSAVRCTCQAIWILQVQCTKKRAMHLHKT